MQAIGGMTRSRAATVRSPLTLVLMGHVGLAMALFISDGFDQLTALLMVTAAFGAWGVATFRVATTGATMASEEGADRLMWAAALASGATAFLRAPGPKLTVSLAPFHVISFFVLALVSSYAVDVFGLAPVPRLLALARRALLFIAALAIGRWIINGAPNPPIDVYELHQQVADAMLQGKSIYEPGVVNTLETFFHKNTIDVYVYPPLPALLSTLSYFFTREVRWADLVGILMGAGLLWLAAKKSFARQVGVPRAEVWADLLAISLLFHPRGWMVLQLNWVEPLCLPFLGTFVLACMARRRIVAAVSLGLLCACKQHLILYLPWLAMAEGVGIPGAALALTTMAVTIVPFAMRSPDGFLRGVWLSHKLGPFRGDALSITGQVSSRFIMPSWVGFAAAMLPFRWLRQLRPRLGPLLLGSCMTFGLFYVLGRQAFLNYYYLLDATALFAIATLGEGIGQPGGEPAEALASAAYTAQ